MNGLFSPSILVVTYEYTLLFHYYILILGHKWIWYVFAVQVTLFRVVDEIWMDVLALQELTHIRSCCPFSIEKPAQNQPDSKVHGAHMGPIWGRQDPGGPHVGSMNFVIWALFNCWALCACFTVLNVKVDANPGKSRFWFVSIWQVSQM